MHVGRPGLGLGGKGSTQVMASESHSEGLCSSCVSLRALSLAPDWALTLATD